MFTITLFTSSAAVARWLILGYNGYATNAGRGLRVTIDLADIADLSGIVGPGVSVGGIAYA